MFYFLDHDDSNSADLSISGKDYVSLIDTCFRYSVYFSLNIGFLRRKSISIDLPKPYRIVENCKLPSINADIAILPCSETTREYMLHRVEDLFEWIDWYNNPEDLIFYRQDGSIFFWSLIHEGVCCLVNRPQEDVTHIVSSSTWYEYSREQHPVFYIPNGIADFKLNCADA